MSGGGIGTYCYQWAKHLVKLQVEITVFLVNRSVNGYRETTLEGIRIIEFGAYLEDSSSFLGYETAIAVSYEKIIRLFIDKEGKPHVIESQEYNGIAYFILQRKALGYQVYDGVPVIINCHCPSFVAFEYNHINTYQLPYFWIGEMERFCLKAADICISPSQYLVDILLKKHPELERKYHILKNPFNMADITVADNMHTTEDAVFFGKLSPIKGIMELLKAFAELWNEGLEDKLTLVGDEYYFYHGVQNFMGKYLREKYALYIQKGLLSLKGAIVQNRIDEMARAARLIVIPSSFDNFPYAVLEMMAREKLVLASDAGGHREILIHEENGLLYHSGNIEDLKSKITQAFSLTADAREKLGKNAARSVKQYCDPDKYYDAKMNLLKDVDPESRPDFPFLQIKSSTSRVTSGSVKAGLLSVIVPFYNMAGYIDETIASIKASSYKNIEIIIVDDGSNETESIQKLETLRNQQGITVIRQNNKGLPEVRNRGSEHASGEFLAFLDADDLVMPEYYSTAINILRNKNNVHFVGCWVKYFGESGNSWPSFTPEPPYLLFHNMVNSSGLVYRRSSFVKAGRNDKDFIYGMEDYDSVISMVEQGFGGVVIPEKHFLYRVRKDSMSRGFNKSNMAYTYELLTGKHKQFYANFGPEITNIMNANGPGFNYENPTLDYHLYSTGSMRNFLVRNLIKRIKRQPVLRRIAINFYRRLKLLLL